MPQANEMQEDSGRWYAVQFRAHSLWEERGRPWGTPEIDWFRAERELEDQRPAPEPAAITAAKAVGSVLGSVAELVSSVAKSLVSE